MSKKFETGFCPGSNPGRSANQKSNQEQKMDITITTPTILFPAVSLLMLAYINRFHALATAIRELHKTYKTVANQTTLKEISTFRIRIRLIKNMQGCGMASMSLCTISILSLLLNFTTAGKIIFGLSLISMLISLALSIAEIKMSAIALDLHLEDIEKNPQQ